MGNFKFGIFWLVFLFGVIGKDIGVVRFSCGIGICCCCGVFVGYDWVYIGFEFGWYVCGDWFMVCGIIGISKYWSEVFGVLEVIWFCRGCGWDENR